MHVFFTIIIPFIICNFILDFNFHFLYNVYIYIYF